MSENEIERVATRAASKAVALLMPHFEATTKQIVEDARNMSFMAATGEEWEKRGQVKDAIQWSIDQRKKAKRILNGFWGAIGSGVAGAIIAIVTYHLSAG